MKMIAVSDVHIDAASFGKTNPRTGRHTSWESNARTLHEAIYAGVDHEAEVLLLPGDLFIRCWPQVEVQEMLADEIRFATQAGMEVVIIPGNHEFIGLNAGHRHALYRYIDMPGVHVVADRPRVVTVAGGYQIACFPWPRRTDYAERLAGTEPQDLDQAIGDLVRQDLEQLEQEFDRQSAGVLIAHLAVDAVPVGSARRGSEMEMVVTQTEISVPMKWLEAGPYKQIVLGHIHNRQMIGDRAHYVGSPNRHTWSEEGQEKAASLIDEDGHVTALPLHPRELLSIHLPQDKDKLDQVGEDTQVRIYYDAGEVDIHSVRKEVRGQISQEIPMQPASPEAEDQMASLGGTTIDTRAAVSEWISGKTVDNAQIHRRAMMLFDTLAAEVGAPAAQ